MNVFEILKMPKFNLYNLYLVVYLIQILSACTAEPEFTPISSWSQLSNFPGPPRASASSFVSGSKAYICLGRKELRSGFLKDLWEYNSETDHWTRKTDFPGKGRVKAIAGVIGDKAYIGLGCVSAYSGNQFSDLWEYDLLTDTWKEMAPFPGVAKTDLSFAVIDSCIYTTNGFAETSFNSESYQFNPRTNAWKKMKNSPLVRSSMAWFAINNTFYMGSGYEGGGHKDFYAYQMQTDQWKRVADLPQARVLSQGLTVNGKGYVLLGRYWDGALNGGKLLKSIVEYDPQLNKWTSRGDFPGGARQNALVFSINGKGYVMAGEDEQVCKSDVWMFQP